MAIPLLGALLPILDRVLDKAIPDPTERAKMQLELAKLAQEEARMASTERVDQMEVNKVEAAHSSIFVAGWRPGAGWVCVVGLAYTIIIAPVTGLPVSDTPFLRDILLGMLGINVAARSVEKLKGVAQNTLTGTANEPVAQIAPKPKKKVLGVEWPF